MRTRFRLAAAAVLAALLLAAPTAVASAQPPTGPDSAVCFTATLDVTNATAALDGLTGGSPSLVELQATLAAAVGAPAIAAAQANVDARVAAIAEAQAKVDAAVLVRDKACAAPAETPAPAPAPAPGPAAPAPAGTPAAADLDCADFPLPNGATAQKVYDADRADPNKLDQDGDGQACELGEGIDGVTGGPAKGSQQGSFSQIGRAPTGSAETGQE